MKVWLVKNANESWTTIHGQRPKVGAWGWGSSKQLATLYRNLGLPVPKRGEMLIGELTVKFKAEKKGKVKT